MEKERISIKMATCTKDNGNGTRNTGMVFIRIKTEKCEFILRSWLVLSRNWLSTFSLCYLPQHKDTSRANKRIIEIITRSVSDVSFCISLVRKMLRNYYFNYTDFKRRKMWRKKIIFHFDQRNCATFVHAQLSFLYGRFKTETENVFCVLVF